MGWLSGILSGYADRQGEIRKEAAIRDEQTAQREAAVYDRLLSSEDETLRNYGATGILQMGQGRKRKSGFAGWMGEMESSPIYPVVQKYMRTPQTVEVTDTPPGPRPPSPAGQLPAVPGQTPSLAQPAASPTQGAPMAAPQPVPTPPPTATQAATPPPAPPLSLRPPPPLGEPWPDGGKGTYTGEVQDPEPPESLTPEPPPPLPWTGGPARDAYVWQPGQTPPFQSQIEEPAPPPPAPPAPPAPPVPQTRTVTRYPRFPNAEDLATSAARAKSLGDFRGDLAGYTEMFRAAGDPNPEKSAADAILQEHARRSGAMPFQMQEVEYVDPTTGKIVRALGGYDKGHNQINDISTGLPFPGRVVKSMPYSSLGQGQYVNQAMDELHVTYDDMRSDPSISAVVQSRALELRQAASKASGLGTAEARVEGALSPAVTTAARLPFGTRGSQLTGQIIPLPAQADRRIALNTMADWIDRIDAAMEVLPKNDGLGGYAPGIAIATMRSLPEYRVAFAKLDADINQILAALSRSVQENKGTQTEEDAKRAEKTLGEVLGRLRNPLEGDTQESGRARLVETRAYLQSQLAAMPPTPVPTALPGGGATPRTTPAPAPAPGGAGDFYWDAATNTFKQR